MDRISLINKIAEVLFSKRCKEAERSVSRLPLSVNSIINDKLIEEISNNYSLSEVELLDEFILRRIYLYLIINEKIPPEVEKPIGRFQSKIKEEKSAQRYSARSL